MGSENETVWETLIQTKLIKAYMWVLTILFPGVPDENNSKFCLDLSLILRIFELCISLIHSTLTDNKLFASLPDF